MQMTSAVHSFASISYSHTTSRHLIKRRRRLYTVQHAAVTCVTRDEPCTMFSVHVITMHTYTYTATRLEDTYAYTRTPKPCWCVTSWRKHECTYTALLSLSTHKSTMVCQLLDHLAFNTIRGVFIHTLAYTHNIGWIYKPERLKLTSLNPDLIYFRLNQYPLL